MKRHVLTLLIVFAGLWPLPSPIAKAQTPPAEGRIDRGIETRIDPRPHDFARRYTRLSRASLLPPGWRA